MSEYKKSDFDNHHGHVMSGWFHPSVHEAYRMQVLAYEDSPEYRSHIQAFLQGRLDRLKAHPEELIEHVKAELLQLEGTWEERKIFPVSARKSRLDATLKLLPPYLSRLAEKEKVTLCFVDGMPAESYPAHGVSFPKSNVIAVVNEYLDEHAPKPVSKFGTIIKEELLHHFSIKWGWTERPEFIKSMKMLVKDKSRIAAINEMKRKIPEIAAKADDIGEYGRDPRELLVDCFHIRDFCAKLYSPTEVTERMDALFGADIRGGVSASSRR